MASDGVNVNAVYAKEVPRALGVCGFACHPEGSVYATWEPQPRGLVMRKLQTYLPVLAPNLCKYRKHAYLLLLQDWSDVTDKIVPRRDVTLDDVLAEQPTLDRRYFQPSPKRRGDRPSELKEPRVVNFAQMPHPASPRPLN
jgi:hypothetical protein